VAVLRLLCATNAINHTNRNGQSYRTFNTACTKHTQDNSRINEYHTRLAIVTNDAYPKCLVIPYLHITPIPRGHRRAGGGGKRKILIDNFAETSSDLVRWTADRLPWETPAYAKQ